MCRLHKAMPPPGPSPFGEFMVENSPMMLFSSSRCPPKVSNQQTRAGDIHQPKTTMEMQYRPEYPYTKAME